MARGLVEEALAPARRALTEEAYDLLRAELIIALLSTPEGQAQLRRARPAPQVDRSGDVVKGDAAEAAMPVTSAGSKTARGKS